MKPKDSAGRFRRLVVRTGKDLSALHVADALGLMIQFYQSEPASGLEAGNEQADMLLFQWGGSGPSGTGASFEINFTRQFIEAAKPGYQGIISQLSLTLHFPSSAATNALGGGDRWHDGSKAGIPAWRAFVLANTAFKHTEGLKPRRVELYWDEV